MSFPPHCNTITNCFNEEVLQQGRSQTPKLQIFFLNPSVPTPHQIIFMIQQLKEFLARKIQGSSSGGLKSILGLVFQVEPSFQKNIAGFFFFTALATTLTETRAGSLRTPFHFDSDSACNCAITVPYACKNPITLQCHNA